MYSSNQCCGPCHFNTIPVPVQVPTSNFPSYGSSSGSGFGPGYGSCSVHSFDTILKIKFLSTIFLLKLDGNGLILTWNVLLLWFLFKLMHSISPFWTCITTVGLFVSLNLNRMNVSTYGNQLATCMATVCNLCSPCRIPGELQGQPRGQVPAGGGRGCHRHRRRLLTG